MKKTIGVAISSFGDKKWSELGKRRALLSVNKQTISPDKICHMHISDDDVSLGWVRNEAAKELGTDYFIFLDADDKLDANYIKNISQIDADVIQPSTLGFYPNGEEDREPVLIPKKPLITGNYIVIGAMIDSKKFWEVGGFGDENMYEDWALYLKLEEVGARFDSCPEAIYKVFVKPVGRNTPGRAQQDYWFGTIKKEAMARRGMISV